MIPEKIESLRDRGILSSAQADTLSGLERGEPFSVHAEVRAFFYAGVLLIAAGAAATVKRYFSSLGPPVLVGGLSAAALACLAYVARRGKPWSRDAVPSPTAAFDYVLFLSCLLFSLDLGYAESRWHLLGGEWRRHFLPVAALFLALAYRHDNRLVLSLGLSSLAAWIGLEFKGAGSLFWDFPWESALVFGVVCLGTGAWFSCRRIKAHFLDVYLNFASLSLGGGLFSQTARQGLGSFHAYALAALCAGGALFAFRSRKFVYLVYASLFGYAGLSAVIFKTVHFHSVAFPLFYFALSPLVLAGFLFWASRSVKEAA